MGLLFPVEDPCGLLQSHEQYRPWEIAGGAAAGDNHATFCGSHEVNKSRATRAARPSINDSENA